MSLINNGNKCSRHGNSGELSSRSLGSCGTVHAEIRHCSRRPGLDTDVHKSLDLLCDHFIILTFVLRLSVFGTRSLYLSRRFILEWIPDFSSVFSSKKGSKHSVKAMAFWWLQAPLDCSRCTNNTLNDSLSLLNQDSFFYTHFLRFHCLLVFVAWSWVISGIFPLSEMVNSRLTELDIYLPVYLFKTDTIMIHRMILINTEW